MLKFKVSRPRSAAGRTPCVPDNGGRKTNLKKCSNSGKVIKFVRFADEEGERLSLTESEDSGDSGLAIRHDGEGKEEDFTTNCSEESSEITGQFKELPVEVGPLVIETDDDEGVYGGVIGSEKDALERIDSDLNAQDEGCIVSEHPDDSLDNKDIEVSSGLHLEKQLDTQDLRASSGLHLDECLDSSDDSEGRKGSSISQDSDFCSLSVDVVVHQDADHCTVWDDDAVCTADVHPDSSSGIASDSGNYTPCEHFGNSGDSDSYPSSSHWGHSPPRTAKQDRTYWDDRRSSNAWRQSNMCQTPRDGVCKGQLQPRYSPVGYYPRDCFTPNGPGPPPDVDFTGYTQFPPQGADYLSGDTGKLYSAVKKRTRVCYFDYLPDDVVIKIFSGLNSDELCRSSRVCRRWYQLVWDVSLWTTIRIHSSELDIDKALKVLTKKLSMDTPTVCVMVERIDLSHCTYLTDKGLHVVAKRCPELRHLVIQGCPNVTNIAVFELVSRCVSLETLNVAGCACITCICLTPEATVQASTYGKQVYLRYLDMSECPELDDAGLQMVAAFCSQLTYLYLRHCSKISDIGVQYVANYCVNLREFSITDCFRVTDFGIRELAKLGNNLRYLSIAKCDKVSDVGMKQVVKYCRKLRYLNMRGCEAISDETIERLGQCCRRLRSLDIGKCDITDHSLHILAENCPQLKKLSLKACDGVTDEGVMVLGRSCRQLQQLNIQDCHISVDAYRVVRRYCQKCFIEHTNPGFF